MPNPIAYLALFLWPVVAVVMFRRMNVPAALSWTILGGYLLLPVRPVIDFPLLPALDKTLIPALSAAVILWATKPDLRLMRHRSAGATGKEASASGSVSGGASGPGRSTPRGGLAGLTGPAGAVPGRAAAMTGGNTPMVQAGGGYPGPGQAGRGQAGRGQVGGMRAGEPDPSQDSPQSSPAGPSRVMAMLAGAGGRQGRWISNALIGLLLIGTVPTMINNSETLVYGFRVLKGLRLYDVGSLCLEVLVVLLPFLLARRYLATESAHRILLRAFAIGGLIYTVPILIEIRLSPQLNVWIYGFFPHSFAQHIRAGGFRPIVFMEHGLWLGIFMAMTVIAAVGMWRSSPATDPRRRLWLVAAAWLFFVLFLSKTLGAFAIATVLGLAGLLLLPRGQLLLAAALSFVVLFYPMLRGAGLVPVDSVVQMARDVSADRANSLEFRLRNEDQLLAKANQKPLFGWGSWGRNRVYNEAGYDISVTDGAWIIEIGISGWLGYIGKFGLLTLPVFWALLRRRRLQLGTASVFLVLGLTANLFDLLPNGTLTPLTWMLAGALVGRCELGPAGERRTSDETGDETSGAEDPVLARRRRQGLQLKGRAGSPAPAGRAGSPASSGAGLGTASLPTVP